MHNLRSPITFRWIIGVCLVVCAVLPVWVSAAAEDVGTAISQSVLIPGPACLDVPEFMFPEGSGMTASDACTNDAHQQWLKTLRLYRATLKKFIDYNGQRYDLPELKWTQSNFVQALMMVQDRYFYDPAAGEYTVDRYLDDL